jgi:hypothetical protein
MLYIEFGRNRLVGLAAIGKKHTGNGRRTHARTQTKITVPRFRSETNIHAHAIVIGNRETTSILFFGKHSRS